MRDETSMCSRFPFEFLSNSHLKAFHINEQQWPKGRFHPEPTWFDQTEKFSGCGGPRPRADAPAAGGAAHHQTWAMTDSELNGYASLPSEQWHAKQDFYGLLTFFFFFLSVWLPTSVHSVRYQLHALPPLNSWMEQLVPGNMLSRHIHWGCNW